MNKEFEFLKIIASKIKNPNFLGNDCAYLDELKLAVSSDNLIEDVHFSLEYMTPYEIAIKAMLVNISDILASGARPLYAILSLSGNFDDKFIEEFYSGISYIENKFNISVIGGDLTKSDKIMISVTVMGDYKNRKVSSRYNAKEDYVVACVGEFGSSAHGLSELKNNIKDSYFINYHKEPVLYPEISDKISKLAEYPYAMMDSSDGLIDCLIQISNKSNVKIEVDYDKIPKKINDYDMVLYGGEDYSLVICLDKRDFKKIDSLIEIGSCSSGIGVYINNKKIEHKGYKHFE